MVESHIPAYSTAEDGLGIKRFLLAWRTFANTCSEIDARRRGSMTQRGQQSRCQPCGIVQHSLRALAEMKDTVRTRPRKEESSNNPTYKVIVKTVPSQNFSRFSILCQTLRGTFGMFASATFNLLLPAQLRASPYCILKHRTSSPPPPRLPHTYIHTYYVLADCYVHNQVFTSIHACMQANKHACMNAVQCSAGQGGSADTHCTAV